MILLLALLATFPLVAQEDGHGVHDKFNLARISSPQRTWESLIHLTDIYCEVIKTEGYTSENEERLYSLENQITKLFDLRQIAPSVRETTAIEAAVYLREILSRFEPYPFDELPTRGEAFAEMKSGAPPMWSINDTDIVIVFVDEGPFVGSFQFSERTLEYADEMYAVVKSMDYRDEKIAGFYEAYFMTPGPLIPSSWIRALPKWMLVSVANQSIWQWICLVIGFAFLILIILLLFNVLLKLSANWLPPFRGVFRLLLPLLATWLTAMLVEFLDDHIFITGNVLAGLYYIDETVELISLMAAVLIFGNMLVGIIAQRQKKNPVTIDTQLIRFAIRILSMLLSVLVLIQGLSRMGVPLATVLTGAGVTGLAIALAAQESLRNIFGSMMILLDKPFKVGQRIVVRGQDGVVEEIGLRSTRIRLLNGHVASLPNEIVANTDVVNIGERPFIRRLFNVRIAYGTPPEKIDEAQAIIEDVLAVKEVDGVKQNESINAADYPPRVFFNDLKDDALNIMVIYWHFPPDYWAFMAQVGKINRELVRRFNEAGIEFAMPTHTVHLAGETGQEVALDPETGTPEAPAG